MDWKGIIGLDVWDQDKVWAASFPVERYLPKQGRLAPLNPERAVPVPIRD